MVNTTVDRSNVFKKFKQTNFQNTLWRMTDEQLRKFSLAVTKDLEEERVVGLVYTRTGVSAPFRVYGGHVDSGKALIGDSIRIKLTIWNGYYPSPEIGFFWNFDGGTFLYALPFDEATTSQGYIIFFSEHPSNHGCYRNVLVNVGATMFPANEYDEMFDKHLKKYY